MTKHEAMKFNEGYEGYRLAYIENKFYFFQKKIGNKYLLIKLSLKDLTSKNYKQMFKLDVSR